MRGIRACLCACSTLSLIVGTASPAFAQDASDGTVQQRADTSGARSPTEIVVTSQKSVERLQDVPIAISAFSGASLSSQDVEGGIDLMKAGPTLTFSTTNSHRSTQSNPALATKPA